MSKSIGLYIHIPFCKSKCPYCDFFSCRASDDEYEKYTEILISKIKYWSSIAKESVATVYFGGGTPSVLGTERLCRILNSITSNFNVLENAEITTEVNPESALKIDFSQLASAGFNRISVGMQSAVTREIKALGRIHSVEDAKITVKKAKNSGINNISLDLMMGIPYQTIESLEESIRFCDSCGVTHISSYILKIEENTKFYDIQHKLTLPDEDEQANLYLYAVKLLDELGYKQYEISNFAKAGFESKHNSSYWQCKEYIGIGPSAHSFYNGKRFYYGRSIDDFANDKIIDDGIGGTEEEFIMLSLRLKKGLCFDEYEQIFSKALSPTIIKKSEKYIKSGYMNLSDKRLCFTPKGFLVSNSIICDLI